ncbi:MAG: DUF1549 domain-containing protein [Planctomycetes bacterium]|nr:DUF1549 domain-containing protein [Planctomycetota bacterium]
MTRLPQPSWPLAGHLVAAWALACSAAAVAGVPSPRLEVFPPTIRLDGDHDAQGLVVRLVQPDGVTRDLTDEAVLTCAPRDSVRLDGATVWPIADGEAVITVAAAGLTAQVPLTVTNATTARPVSFRRDVIPALTKAGCNSGSCHGSARGRDGFHLSLFGYDPDGDHRALTRELPGRRVNPAWPQESLLLQKATGTVPHTGGPRLAVDGLDYSSIVAWLEAGAPNDVADAPAVTSLEVYPQAIVLEGPGATQRITVRAGYSDGTDRDVTRLAVLMSNNDVVAVVAEGRVITAGRRGEAQILARFDALTVGTQVIVIPSGMDDPYPDLPENNYIDTLVHDKLRKMRLIPAELCTDAEFLRRATIDVVGLLPTVAEIERFLADQSPDRRDHLVDELLSRKEFVELWVMKWAERLQLRSNDEVSYKAALLYYNRIQHHLANNLPLNDLVRELLAAQGGTFSNPATNFYQLERDTLKLSENVAQAFMGVRLQCAQCHNHPFDRWTMDDYYGFAAFFAQIGRKQAEDPRETIVFDSRSGEIKHPVGDRPVRPKFLGGPEPNTAGRDRRAVLAEWLTAPENPFFARNLANFAWAHFFGRGIVEPVDDARVSNPPSNAALLDALADHLTRYGYDFRRLVRDICTSRIYQLSCRAGDSNADDQTNFSKSAVRRIRAEVLLDLICQATGSPEKFRGLSLGARAVQIADGNTTNYFLTTFGRSPRRTVCTCEVVTEPNLSQALHLINGDTVHRKITTGRLVPSLLEAGRSSEQIVDHLYLTCVTRRPTDAERAKIMELVAESENSIPPLEDLFWALLNSKEFLFNIRPWNERTPNNPASREL